MPCLAVRSQTVTGFLIRSLIYTARECIVGVTAYIDCHGLRLLEHAASRGVKVVLFYDKLRCPKRPDNITLIHERNHYKHYLADGEVFIRATSNLTWSELEGFSRNTAELEIVNDIKEAGTCRVSSEVLMVTCSVFSAHREAAGQLAGTPCAELLNLCH